MNSSIQLIIHSEVGIYESKILGEKVRKYAFDQKKVRFQKKKKKENTLST